MKIAWIKLRISEKKFSLSSVSNERQNPIYDRKNNFSMELTEHK